MTAPSSSPSRPAPQVATPAAWRFQPYYGRRVSDGPVRNRYGSLFVPVPGQQIGSQSVVMTIGFKGQVDDCYLIISDEHARLIEAAPVMRDALRASRDAIRKIAFVAHKQSLTNEERVSDIASVSDLALTAVEAALDLAHGAAPVGGANPEEKL